MFEKLKSVAALVIIIMSSVASKHCPDLTYVTNKLNMYACVFVTSGKIICTYIVHCHLYVGMKGMHQTNTQLLPVYGIVAQHRHVFVVCQPTGWRWWRWHPEHHITQLQCTQRYLWLVRCFHRHWLTFEIFIVHTAYIFTAVASGYASQHIPSRSPSPEIGRVETGRASSVKYRGLHGWAYSHSRLCGCCRPASGYTARGVSERGRAIYQGPHQLQI